MEILKFKVTLLSDVIISESPATQGRHRGLDFIPGNNFLGIAASRIYKEETPHTYLLFHSGHVRFGDANPGYKNIRGHRTPACFFKAKYPSNLPEGGDDQTRYVHHRIGNFTKLLDAQLKQCRGGFMAFEGKGVHEIAPSRNYAVKSAYDSSKRRAKDEKLFGYESLVKGTVLYFSVELDDEAVEYKGELSDALTGIRHIGRSRSAQFGLVRIEPFSYEDTCGSATGEGQVGVYADGRLFFFDKEGQPTLCPTAEQLGVKGGQIDWSKSQIRTFQYAPWNFRRQAFDNERCGVEKGSVLVVSGNVDAGEATVGAYQNEGFGKVIYNPSFLKAGTNGKSELRFESGEKGAIPSETVDDWTARYADNTLMAYLNRVKTHRAEEKCTYDLVDIFVRDYKGLFSAVTPSQWGTIRGIAMSTANADNILDNIEKYLSRGVAKETWDERGRRGKLKKFLGDNSSIVPIRDLVINLASEMAKEKNR